MKTPTRPPLRLSSRSGDVAQADRGFSFLEIMITVVIIGIMTSIAVPLLKNRTTRARITMTRNQMANIKTALGLYEIEVGDYPGTEQGLEALVRRPSDVSVEMWTKCLEEVPRDGWNHGFIYRVPGEDGSSYDLISRGKDNKEGTEDDISLSRKEGESHLH